MPINLAGKVIFFSGEFGGSDGRRPIDAKTKTPNEDYVLCDGITTNGLPVPDLRGRMILGASDAHPAGSTGGSETHAHSLSGTVGSTTLTVEQLASHAHLANLFVPVSGQGLQGTTSAQTGNASTYTESAGGSQPHTHPIEGTVSVERSLPPYYALAAVMYIGD